MSWATADDFSFEQEDSFVGNSFGNDIDTFLNSDSFHNPIYDDISTYQSVSENEMTEESNYQQDIKTSHDQSETITQLPLKRSISFSKREQNKNDFDELAEENNRLREYVATLQQRAEEATRQNEKLKSQLQAWRVGFSQAMFHGIRKN